MKEERPHEPLSLMGELRRRKVLYTAVVYGISAFAFTEIATFLFENFGAPQWAVRLMAALFVAGFPVAMYLSWAFDIGADGVVRASTGDRRSRWRTIALALGLLIMATGGLFYLIFPKPQAPTVAGAPGTEPGAPNADYGFEPAEKLENSIAVLPFENLSTDPENAFFSSGVAEEILNHLGAYGELNIIGRTSSFVFDDREIPAPKISALLGVRYLLQGSVRRHQDQVRVSTQLLDENGVQLWSRNFDRRLADIFAIQTEIAVAVAEAVVPEITIRAPELRPTNLDAYDHYLKGRDLIHQRQVDAAAEALKRATELDPQFAPAYAELAIALAIGQRRIESAREAVDTALSLQPGLLRALAARGLILQMQQSPDWSASEAVLRRVLAQEPNMTDAIMWLSQALGVQGFDEESEELTARALRIDPLHPTLSRNAATVAAERGEDRRAIAIARRVIESPENTSYHPYVFLFRLYKSRGRLTEVARVAREWTDKSARTETLVNPCYCLLIWAHSLLGDRALTEYWFERSGREFPESWWTDFFEVFSLRWQGRYRDALSAADAHFRQRFGEEDEFGVGPMVMLGVLEALAGDHSEAIERLSPLGDVPRMSAPEGADAVQALAWAYAKTGQADRAEPLLAELEDAFEKLERQGTLFFHMADVPYGYALNAALRGEDEQALERLEAIMESGWRGYYLQHHDPRWGALREHPRFQALMAKVKADVDRQRAELEAMEPEEAFVTRLDASISAAGESTN